MQLVRASRKNTPMKMALQGPSGSGKTFSALLVAFGLCNDWNKIAVVDTENHSAELYSNLGPYRVLNVEAPFSPERYSEAIRICEAAGMEVIIIDSLSHEWEFIIDYHSSLVGNSFTNWAKVTPRHNGFVQAILGSPCHVIGTIRTKSDYVLSEKNGKTVPEKIGLKANQRDGLDFEFTLVFDLDIKNHASASKDRTGLFFGQPEQKLSVSAGKRILQWCHSGEVIQVEDVSARIGNCKSLNELLQLYKTFPQHNQALQPEFEQRKRELILTAKEFQPQFPNQPIHQNGKS